MSTLLLDRTTWDLCLDASNNIAVAEVPYAVAQDVATMCRLFQGDCYYDQTLGLPYFAQILGQTPSVALLKSLYAQQALLVPTVATVQPSFDGINSQRQLVGTIAFTTSDGVPLTVSLAGGPV